MKISKNSGSMWDTGYGILIVDMSKSKILNHAATLCQMLGYEEVDTEWQGALENWKFMSKEEKKRMSKLVFSQCAENGFAIMKSSVIDKTGGVMPVTIYGTAFFNDVGKKLYRLVLMPGNAAGGEYIEGGRKDVTESLKKIFEDLDEKVYVVDKKTHKILYANPAITGYYQESVLGKICYQIFSVEEDMCKNCIIRSMETEQASQKGDLLVGTKDEFSYKILGLEIMWEDIPAYLMIYYTIKPSEEKTAGWKTGLLRQRRMIEAFQGQYSVMTEINMKTGAYLTTANTADYPFVDNPSGENYMLQEKKLMEHVAYPADREKIMEAIGYENMVRDFQNGNTKMRECVFRMYEAGSLVWKEVRAVFNGDMENPYILLSVRDVTDERKKQEIELVDKARLLKAVSYVFFISISVELQEDTYKITHNNFQSELQQEGSYSEFIEQLAELMHPADRKTFLNTCEKKVLLNKIQNGQEHFYCECRRMDENDQFIYTGIDINVLNEGKRDETRIMIMMRDIDERKRREQKLQQALEREENANVVKAKLLSKISGEMDTNGQKYIQLIQELRQHCMDNPAAMVLMEKMMGQAEHMVNMVDDIKSITQIENDNISIDEAPFDMKDFIETIRKRIEPEAERQHVKFQVVEKGDTDGRFLGDAMHIRQILDQILFNAVTHSISGGHVTLFVRQIDTEGVNESFQFTIEDEGVGIDKELLERIFYAADKTGQKGGGIASGVGFGLLIVKRLVDMLGGSIDVRSLSGKGTIFQISLTLRRLPEEENAKQGEYQTDRLQGKRILFAEDNRLNQEMGVTLLKFMGLEVECVSHGQEAVQQFASKPKGYYHAILMDLDMPLKNGYQATKEIREFKRGDAMEIPIIAMFEVGSGIEQEKLETAGMDEGIYKPLETEILASTLLKYL